MSQIKPYGVILKIISRRKKYTQKDIYSMGFFHKTFFKKQAKPEG